MYRIVHAPHPRTGDAWCIYPTYDWAHGQSDAIEGITHSICTLEFEDHRPLYEWFVERLDLPSPPRQIEFARLNLSHTIMSKRKLLKLVTTGAVRGWDDPRMPTISGLRRRGYTPEAIRTFCDMIGVAKRNSTVDMAQLEYAIRDDLNRKVRRVMGVLNPLKVVITNFPEEGIEDLDAPYFPDDPEQMGWRKVPFTRELYIDRNDFRLEPPRRYFRLAPDREVRLRWGYFIHCTDVVTDPDTGEVTELHCTFDPATRGGSAPDGRKVKGTIHWVSADHAIDAEVRLYEALLAVPELPEDATDVLDHLNPGSEQVLTGCKLEPSLATAEPGDRFQLERTGYFCVDPDATPGRPVLNRTVTLRDSWAKIEKQMGGGNR
jgi:glutaminyl-tRNA synthetase